MFVSIIQKRDAKEFPPISFCRRIVVGSPIFSYCSFHLPLKSRNRLRYSLLFVHFLFIPIIRGTDMISASAANHLTYAFPYTIYRVLCVKAARYVQAVCCRRIYVSFVMHIYSRRQTSSPFESAATLINLQTRKGFSRNKYFVGRVRVIVVDAIESSCTSSFPYL